MRIEHLAIWTGDLAKLRDFYESYFDAEAGAPYVSENRDFESCFLRFSGGARLELMYDPTVSTTHTTNTFHAGYAHVAFSAGSQERVDALTARLQRDGYKVVSVPRFTGDGYYESVVLDPDGNYVEITV